MKGCSPFPSLNCLLGMVKILLDLQSSVNINDSHSNLSLEYWVHCYSLVVKMIFEKNAQILYSSHSIHRRTHLLCMPLQFCTWHSFIQRMSVGYCLYIWDWNERRNSVKCLLSEVFHGVCGLFEKGSPVHVQS